MNFLVIRTPKASDRGAVAGGQNKKFALSEMPKLRASNALEVALRLSTANYAAYNGSKFTEKTILYCSNGQV